jgi:MFS family permease
MHGLAGQMSRAVRDSRKLLDAALGGPARRHVVLLLAAGLGLASADQATIGASATQLRSALNLSHADLGLLAAASGLVAAVATVPVGSMADRVNRTRLLSAGVAMWAVVMAASASAGSFPELLLIRCALGAVVAVAAPATASLIGDFFAPGERGRIWGYVLAGELVGAGVGFTIAGGFASISWRAPFLVLAIPAVALALVLWRLPEPPRGGRGRLAEGAQRVGDDSPSSTAEAGKAEPSPMSRAQLAAAASDALEPNADMVLDDDPHDWSLWHAVRYVLRIRTNVILIAVGAGGYFFFAGVRAFGVEFVKSQYGIGQGFASMLALILGGFAIGGVLISGQLSDRLGTAGRLAARVWIGATALAGACIMFVPALLVSSALWGVLALSGAALLLAGLNPPVDAARLDIMHPSLWGRAEAVRTVVRQPVEAVAPLLFGILADDLAGGGRAGLQATFLIMLVPLAVSVVVLLRARRTYPSDVATAAASIERTELGTNARPAA